MNIAVPREVHPGEVRVALIPEHIARLVNAGADVFFLLNGQTEVNGLSAPLAFDDIKVAANTTVTRQSRLRGILFIAVYS